MYEGSYSGILKPGRHYVVLERDHSNMNEVVSILQNNDQAEEIIATAYKEIILNSANHFKAMVNTLDEMINERHDYALHLTKAQPSSIKLETRKSKFLYSLSSPFYKFFVNNAHIFAQMTVQILDYLPRRIAEPVHRQLRNFYRLLTERSNDQYSTLGNLYSSNIFVDFVDFMNFYGWSNMRRNVSSHLKLFSVARRFKAYSFKVREVDDVQLALVFDNSSGTQTFYAYDINKNPDTIQSDSKVEPAFYLAEILKNRDNLDKIIWKPSEIYGISLKQPFGKIEIINLAGITGDQSHLVKMSEYLIEKCTELSVSYYIKN